MNLNPLLLIDLALGLGLLAFGWTLFRFGLNAVGFAAGFLFGYSLYQLIVQFLAEHRPEALQYFPPHTLAPALAGVIAGIVGVMLIKRLYIACIFLGVLAAGLYILYATEQRVVLDHVLESAGVLAPLNRTFDGLWYAVVALLVALLFVYFQKQMIILLTACIGAFVIANTLHTPILFLPLCLAGILLQQKARRTKTVPQTDNTV